MMQEENLVWIWTMCFRGRKQIMLREKENGFVSLILNTFNSSWTAAVRETGNQLEPAACDSVGLGCLTRLRFKLQLSHSLEVSVDANDPADYIRALKLTFLPSFLLDHKDLDWAQPLFQVWSLAF